jgi:hypothetical protein
MQLRSLSHRPNGDTGISDTKPTTPSHKSVLHADYEDPRVQTRPLSRTFFTTPFDCGGCAKLGQGKLWSIQDVPSKGTQFFITVRVAHRD